MTIKIFTENRSDGTYISNANLFGIKITDNNKNNIIKICNLFCEESLTEFKPCIIEKEISQDKIARISVYDHPELDSLGECFEEFPGMEIINIEANGIRITATV